MAHLVPSHAKQVFHAAIILPEIRHLPKKITLRLAWNPTGLEYLGFLFIFGIIFRIISEDNYLILGGFRCDMFYE